MTKIGIALAQDEGTSIAVFESEVAAHAGAARVAGASPGAVTMDSVEVGEIIALA